MSDRLLKESDVLKAINKALDRETLLNRFVRKIVVDAIIQVPSADRPQGEWRKISPARIYECSVCGRQVMTNDIDIYKFCHGCGVRMKEAEDE